MRIWLDSWNKAPDGYEWFNAELPLLGVNDEIFLKEIGLIIRAESETRYTKDEDEKHEEHKSSGIKEIEDLKYDCLAAIESFRKTLLDYYTIEFIDCGSCGYKKILKWLEETGLNYPIRVHAKNPISKFIIRRFIKRNNWTEVKEVISEHTTSREEFNEEFDKMIALVQVFQEKLKELKESEEENKN